MVRRTRWGVSRGGWTRRGPTEDKPGPPMKQLVRAVVFAGFCLPLALMGIEGLGGRLGANPIATIINRLGFWALCFLLLSLAATPLKILVGLTSPVPFRPLT